MEYRYLAQHGAFRFKIDTSRVFASRDNPLLLIIDQALQGWSRGATDEIRQLNAIIQATDLWLKSKRSKAVNGSSFRMRFVCDLQDEARARLSFLHEEAKARAEQLIQERKNALKAEQEREHAAERKAHVARAKQVIMNFTKTRTGDLDKATGGKRLHGDNWLEATDPKHRMGDDLAHHFAQWKQTPATVSFWDHLERLPTQVREDLEKRQVTYLDDLVYRSLFEVVFDQGKMYSAMTPDVQQMVIAGRAKADIFAASKLQALDTTKWPSKGLRDMPDGWAAAVLSANNVLYIGMHMSCVFHHSSFLCGAPVNAACMLKIKDGQVVGIHEKNGHYRASQADVLKLLLFLKLKLPGTRWEDVEYYEFWETQPTTAMAILNKRLGRMLPPLPKQKPPAPEVKKVA